MSMSSDSTAVSAAAAGLITQTDASGKSLTRAGDSFQDDMLRNAHLSQQQARARLEREKQERDAQDDVPLFCSVCTWMLNLLLCTGDTALAAASPMLLPPQPASKRHRKCLVLDLDETLVHSSFTPIPNPDYVLPVEIEGTVHRVYVLKRPGCDDFLTKLGKRYEIVIFTASLSKYASPLLDLLDTSGVIEHRLYREACSVHQGNYVKDLALLGRDLAGTIIVDNSPTSYAFHPENAIAVSSFVDDMSDRELFYALPFLESLADAPDVTKRLHKYPQFVLEQAAQSLAKSRNSAGSARARASAGAAQGRTG